MGRPGRHAPTGAHDGRGVGKSQGYEWTQPLFPNRAACETVSAGPLDCPSNNRAILSRTARFGGDVASWDGYGQSGAAADSDAER